MVGALGRHSKAAYLLKRQLFEACSMHIDVLDCLLEAGELDEDDSLTGSCFLISRTDFQDCSKRPSWNSGVSRLYTASGRGEGSRDL